MFQIYVGTISRWWWWCYPAKKLPSLTTRYKWVTLGVVEEDITNPEMCLTGVDMETGVLDGRFVQDKQMVLGLDSGGVVMVKLTVVEHDNILTGLDLWEKDGSVAQELTRD